MAGKALDSGKAFIDGVLAKLPESLRDSVKAAFAAPEAQDALTLVGDGVLARSDYSKSMDDLKAKEAALTEDYTKLNDWWTTRQADFAELEDWRTGKRTAKPGEPPAPKPPTDPALDPAKFVSRDDFADLLRKEQMAAANAMGLIAYLVDQHRTTYHEALDVRELLADQNLGKAKADGATYGLLDAYHTKFKDKITAFHETADKERIEKRANEIVAEKLKGQSLPVPLKAGLGSPLDVLDNPEWKPAPNLADLAAEEYARLQAARG